MSENLRYRVSITVTDIYGGPVARPQASACLLEGRLADPGPDEDLIALALSQAAVDHIEMP